MDSLRIGQGIDVHCFADGPQAVGRKLVLGGVEIPNAVGLWGHSDADVVLHAVTDAVLGALAWGDIGKWFPDTDSQYLNADSKMLLETVWQKASAESWKLVNLDITVLAQKPRIAPHIEAMQSSIAEVFSALVTQIGIKATTTERLGFVGREEGIVASAVVLLAK